MAFLLGERWMSLRDIAESLGMDPRSVLRHAKDNSIAVRIGRSWRIPHHAFMESLRKNSSGTSCDFVSGDRHE